MTGGSDLEIIIALLQAFVVAPTLGQRLTARPRRCRHKCVVRIKDGFNVYSLGLLRNQLPGTQDALCSYVDQPAHLTGRHEKISPEKCLAFHSRTHLRF
ncbi:hypothetical protein WJX74_006820 [Apatococcus lobatus]|uniref:Secreted protein n=1 Tax=Apatococcus lobatus TaxID=904363 RepID=A0AAW1QI88_9CHLO